MQCSPTVNVDRLKPLYERLDAPPAPGPVSDPGQEGEHEVERCSAARRRGASRATWSGGGATRRRRTRGCARSSCCTARRRRRRVRRRRPPPPPGRPSGPPPAGEAAVPAGVDPLPSVGAVPVGDSGQGTGGPVDRVPQALASPWLGPGQGGLLVGHPLAWPSRSVGDALPGLGRPLVLAGRPSWVGQPAAGRVREILPQ